MSKREMKADRISMEGDFVRLEQKPTKGIAALGGAILGGLVGGPPGALIGGTLGAIGGEEGGIRLIPKSDVVEIIEDPSTKEIRVVIDDDRGKRR